MITLNQTGTLTLLALVPLPTMFAQRFAPAFCARAHCAAFAGLRANLKPMLVRGCRALLGFRA